MEFVISLIPVHCATDKSDTFSRERLNEHHYADTKVGIPNKNIIAAVITPRKKQYRLYSIMIPNNVVAENSVANHVGIDGGRLLFTSQSYCSQQNYLSVRSHKNCRKSRLCNEIVINFLQDLSKIFFYVSVINDNINC